MSESIETITLAGGCFWCVEAVFEQLRGVVDVQSGYSNGQTAAPTYEAVCAGNTGHAEVVRVRFDPHRISLSDLLKVFFATHDPTTRNRQGADVGTQYRSAIYWSDKSQRDLIAQVREEANAELGGRVVTEVEPLANYSAAEAYHQHYFANNPNQGYCAAVIGPKVEKFRKVFGDSLGT
ncbi:MAG: peptide-methionine (S)-S-oxide reductase MsrA [Burkholderiaceae bacterium]|jgi:peptide-methionine (S)-S-oxide reductase